MRSLHRCIHFVARNSFIHFCVERRTHLAGIKAGVWCQLRLSLIALSAQAYEEFWSQEHNQRLAKEVFEIEAGPPKQPSVNHALQ